jgi:mannitol/fructose-specific phosphotransferase system IIA component (Ntr-type)
VYHLFERIGQHRFGGLDRELRGILVEKGLRVSDPFDEVIAGSSVIILPEKTSFEAAVSCASELLEQHIPYTADQLTKHFLDGTQLGVTPVTHGIALPHLRLPNVKRPEMILLQCRSGIKIEADFKIPDFEFSDSPIYAIFFLVSPQENPGQHLRILASLAGHADDDQFIPNWLNASNETQLKELLLKDKNFLSIRVKASSQSAPLIGMAIRDIELPQNCLIAFIHQLNETIIPRGSTILNEFDLVTFIGESEAIEQVYNKYGGYKRKSVTETDK